MSSSGPPAQPPPPPSASQSQASVLGPGIAGLFIQGIESGLVFDQFSQWFYRAERIECTVLTIIVIFVTVLGLAQSGIIFASGWYNYVQQFGMALMPDWADYIQPLLTLLIAVPVQALMIRRCYHLGGKSMSIITLLVLLLVASAVISLYTAVLTFRLYINVVAKNPLYLLQMVGISLPFLATVLLPSVLDITLTGILLYYLTRTKKQVYAAHTRKRISRLVNIVWQSALPPTLCAVCVCAFYIRFTTARQHGFQLWLPVFQQMIGKLYVLSLLYMINAQPSQPDEQPTTFISTLTVPTEMYSFAGARGREARCGDTSAERRTARTVDFAV